MPPDCHDDLLARLIGPDMARRMAEVDRLESAVNAAAAPGLSDALNRLDPVLTATRQASVALRTAGRLTPLAGDLGRAATAAALERIAEARDSLQPSAGPALDDITRRLPPESDFERAASHTARDRIAEAAASLQPWSGDSIAGTLAATDAFGSERAGPSGRLFEHLVGSEPLPVFDGIIRTVHEILDQESRARFAVDDSMRAAASALSAVDGTLEAAGLRPWVDELDEALRQQGFVEELRALGDRFTDDLQTRFTEELLRQPAWQDLLGQLIATRPRDEAGTDPPPPSTDASPVTRERLEQSLEEVVERVVVQETKKLSRAAHLQLGVTLLVSIIGVATTIVDRQRCPEEYDTGKHPAQIQIRTPSGHRVLKSGAALILRDQPLTPISGKRIEGQVRLVERDRIQSWVKVDVQDCEGNLHSGWIPAAALEALDDPPGEACAPAEPAGPTGPSKSAKPDAAVPVPEAVTGAGPAARAAWQEFFAAQIANINTRQAYFRACTRFFDWCQAWGIVLEAIGAADVAAWRNELLQELSAATVKQHLAAVRRLFDWWVVRQVLPVNHAQSVRTARISRERTATPSLQPSQVVALFESFNPDRLPDLRDRALMAVMTFALARASAAASLRTGEVTLEGPSPSIRLPGKRGLELDLPLNPHVADWIGAYIDVAGIGGQPDKPLFRSFGRGRGGHAVTERGLSRQDIYATVRRRMDRSGIGACGGCHALRTSGITLFLMSGIPIEIVARLAGHASIEMTRRYDGRDWRDMQMALHRILGADAESPFGSPEA